MVLMEQIAWPLHAAEAVCKLYFTNKFLYHVVVQWLDLCLTESILIILSNVTEQVSFRLKSL